VESAPDESAPVESAPDESAPEESSDAPQSQSYRILAIGGADVNNLNVTCVTFETVYCGLIQSICEQANVPSLSLIEYGKGWAALATAVRQNGWPRGVDVLQISTSYLNQPALMMELRLLADIVTRG